MKITVPEEEVHHLLYNLPKGTMQYLAEFILLVLVVYPILMLEQVTEVGVKDILAYRVIMTVHVQFSLQIITCVEQFNYYLNALLHLLIFSNTRYSLVVCHASINI